MGSKRFTLRRSRKRIAFTLIELLTVIAIIAILAAMLLPVLATVKKHALVMRARTEIRDLATAIEAYDSAYGRFPVSRDSQTAASKTGPTTGNFDITYGGIYSGVTIGSFVPAGGTTILTNSEVISILMDYTNFPYDGKATVNMNHQYNPQMTKFLNANLSGWNPLAIPLPTGPAPGGVDTLLNYRDPWGNPYLISMDLNYDDQCQDAFYCLKNVSYTGTGLSGFYGLSSPGISTGRGGADNFLFHGKVMVWSVGPDGRVDATGKFKANQGVNKDNILSWQ